MRTSVFGQVVAHGQARLEQEHGPGGIGDRDAVDLHHDMARTAQRVDALVRIAGVNEDLFVLLEPGVHRLPLEADRVTELGDRRQRVLPGSLACLRPSRLDRPETGLPQIRRPLHPA